MGTCFNPNTASVFDWVPNPSLEKLLSAKKTHFISVSKESLAKAREATKYPIFPITIRAKTYGQSRLEECIAYNSPASWWVMKQMPDEVVTEMCRIIYEHADEFQRYHQSGKSISKRTITSVPIPDAKWHPAAARFYASEGLTLGREK